MPAIQRGHLSDLLGATRLAAGATAGLADAVEAMHLAVQRIPFIVGRATAKRSARGATGLVYRTAASAP